MADSKVCRIADPRFVPSAGGVAGGKGGMRLRVAHAIETLREAALDGPLTPHESDALREVLRMLGMGVRRDLELGEDGDSPPLGEVWATSRDEALALARARFVAGPIEVREVEDR